MYDLVQSEHFDAVILVPAGISACSGTAGMLQRFARLASLPTCSVGMVLPGVPSIVADNSIGMAGAIFHVIAHHGRRNLAFLGNEWDNVDCDLRREVFLDVTRKHGIVVPEHRMLRCWLDASSAESAVLRLLDDNPAIDAIIAVNDASAAGAVHALQLRGFATPEQVSVTGYDNLPMAQMVQPSLTSVSQPLAAMATAAVDSIVQQLTGKRPPSVTRLPTELVIRDSCGCNSDSNRATTIKALADAAHRAFEQGLQLEASYGQILEMARRLSLAVNRTELERLVVELLPRVHVQDCFVGFYADAMQNRLRLILPTHLAADQSTVPADASFLSLIGNRDQPRALLVMGLAFRAELLGIIGFDLSEACFDYPAIRDHLASAWQVMTLHDEVVRQTALTERSQQERQAAADRSQAMSAMAGGVAHDLNNALGSLVSLTDVVAAEIGDHCKSGNQVNPEVIDDLRIIKSSALRATETIKDLMTLGRISRTHKEPFDLARLAQNIVDEHMRQLAKAETMVELTAEITSRELIVTGSETHVERAVNNVLRNAIEAVARGGRIKISVFSEVLDWPLHGYELVPPGNYAVVRIADTGSGIDSNNQKRIFEPFFSTKRLGESSGSGLGMAIVQSVLKEHQGYVDLESVPGYGSKFTLYFPKLGNVLKARPSKAPVAGGSARILVVDDDLTQLRTAKRVLSRCGYDVTTMASGAQAYALMVQQAEEHEQKANGSGAERLRSSSYDLIILDLALNEEEDGLEIYNKIRQIFPEQKGLLASGHAFVDHEEQIRAANVVWLPKPYTIESLTTAIRAALRE
jgi:signal transduction histidine kinase/ActR/RegA family two-component response regulator